MKIGIGVTTTSGRNEIASRNIETIRALSEGCKIVVVKDVQGIAKAKNECLRQLDDCEHIFLMDDDVFPKWTHWYESYINTGILHLCFTFSKFHNGMSNGNRILLKTENGLNIYQNPCGCMMYIHKRCIDVIGGFDESFIGYSYEHVDLSRRIYNAGLTPYPFMDTSNSKDLIHSMDYYREVQSSVEPMQRAGFIKHNRPLYEKSVNSREYCRYK